MPKQTTVTEVLVDSLPAEGVLRGRPTPQFLRVAEMLAEILGDYARCELEATSPRSGIREAGADRSRDLKSALATRGFDIKRFHQSYFAVRRDRGQQIRIRVESAQPKEAGEGLGGKLPTAR